MFERFFQLQLFDVRYLFSEKIYLLQGEENGCYGQEPLFWLSNSTGKMMNFSRHNQIKF